MYVHRSNKLLQVFPILGHPTTARRGGLVVVFGAFGAEVRWFESHFSRNVHVGTLSIGQVLHLKLSGPQRACLAVKYDSCNNLLSFVHMFYLLTFCSGSGCT